MDTTDMEKLRILTMWECGKSTAEIAKSVNKSARTVQRWLAHHKREGNMNKKPRGLRPRKTTPEEDALIVQMVKEHPDLTQQEILSLCNLNIYKGTLRRRIQEANGVYKIDLFPKPKSLKKKGPYPKKKKKTLEEGIVKENENSMEAQILNETSPEVSTTLLETYINSENLQDSGSATVHLKCLEYEAQEEFAQQDEDCVAATDDDFHDVAYETGTEVDGFFEITESVKQSLTDDVFDEFISNAGANVKVEIIDTHEDELISDRLELSNVTDDCQSLEDETTLLEDDQEQFDSSIGTMSDSEENNDGRTERIVIEVTDIKEESPRRKRTKKSQREGDDDDDESEGNESFLQVKHRKRRVRKEAPNYIEEFQEGDQEVDDPADKKPKKRGRRKQSAAALGETKKERKKRMKKEQIEWEKDRKDTTDMEKKKILIMAECGMSTEDIARALKKSRRTVQRWISKHNKGLDMERKERGKRPRKTTPEEDARIVQIVKENPHLSRKEILKLANINLHKVTLKSRLNEAGLYFNSQGVKILDFTDREPDSSTILSSSLSSNVLSDNTTNMQEETTLANALITCPTISTTLIIANPNEPAIGNNMLSHLNSLPTLVYSASPTVTSFHDYTLY